MSDLFTHGYALLIGVGNDLPVTVRDAQVINDLLVNKQRAAYPDDHVKLLVENKAKLHNILEGFDSFISQVNADAQATAVVYYSGHGGRLKNEQEETEYFLVPHDYDPMRFSETTLKGKTFTEKIGAIKAQKLIVILDCCHASGVPDIKAPGQRFAKGAAPRSLLQAMEQGSGHVVIASSRSDESSYGAMTNTGNSVFTEVLLEALAGRAARDADGFARILDVLSYLFAHVPERAPGPQHPFVNKIAGLGENFSLCYYAGGAKHLESVPVVAPVANNAQSKWTRYKLERKRDSLMLEYDMGREKISFLAKSVAIQADSAFKFQVQKELLQERLEVAVLEKQLDDVNAALEKIGV